jgi:hypothetical protein
VPAGRWLISNDEVAAHVEAFPDRFAGVAAVDLSNPVAAVRELDRAVRQLGFKALRVVPWLWRLPPNDRLYYPLYVKCIELDIPFCTQVGHTGPLMPSETGRPVPYIDEVALTFPELRIVCGHIGHPWTDEMIGVAWKHDNVYIDTSAYLPRYYPPQLLQFLRTYGQDKVLFGTNFPQLPLDKCMEQVRGLGLPQDIAGYRKQVPLRQCPNRVPSRRRGHIVVQAVLPAAFLGGSSSHHKFAGAETRGNETAKNQVVSSARLRTRAVPPYIAAPAAALLLALLRVADYAAKW